MCYSVTGACGVWSGLDMGLVLGVEVVVECRMIMMTINKEEEVLLGFGLVRFGLGFALWEASFFVIPGIACVLI